MKLVLTIVRRFDKEKDILTAFDKYKSLLSFNDIIVTSLIFVWHSLSEGYLHIIFPIPFILLSNSTSTEREMHYNFSSLEALIFCEQTFEYIFCFEFLLNSLFPKITLLSCDKGINNKLYLFTLENKCN